MRIVVAQSCWNAITFELDRVAPREGVVLPLVAIEHRAEPCARIALADITTLAIAEVRCVPAELQENALLRVAALPRSDAWADAVVLPLVRRSPRLRAAAYLHSHPFAHERTWPSGGDIDGHMLPLLERNRACGLFASFSFIACSRWKLPCFAMDAERRVIELGNAEIVDDADPIITRARATRPPRFWLKRWRQRLRARGFAPHVDELFDGWTRARIDLDAHRVLVVLFPLAFPDETPLYFVVDRRTGKSERVDRTFSLEASEVAA
ncbi:MAG: hypothetical protein M4D80_42680 [Myxococcota bacterium]|nr:hypothetical protein [Myxococcota bacterium]